MDVVAVSADTRNKACSFLEDLRGAVLAVSSETKAGRIHFKVGVVGGDGGGGGGTDGWVYILFYLWERGVGGNCSSYHVAVCPQPGSDLMLNGQGCSLHPPTHQPTLAGCLRSA